MTLLITTLSIALSISFLCSLLEAAILSLTPSQVARMTATHPKQGEIWRRFKWNIDRPISVILFLNTAAHTIGASVAGAQFDELYGTRWIWVFSLVLTFIMLQYTEIAPKTMGVRHNYELALRFAIPLDFTVRKMAPILRLLHFLNRPFLKGRNPGDEAATIDELTSMARLARLSNLIDTSQEAIITNVSKLNMLRAKHIMIPVDQVIFLKAEQTVQTAIEIARNDPHTRFPVYANDDKNQIVGYVNLKEMIFHLRDTPEDAPLQPIRPVRFISPTLTARELLNLFIRDYIHIAIVQDEFRKTVGLITLEDVIEEVLGDLEDEFDKLPKVLQTLPSNTWIAGGGVSTADVERETGVSLDGKPQSLSNWLIDRFGKIPSSGESVRVGDRTFLIRRIRRGKVFEVAIL